MHRTIVRSVRLMPLVVLSALVASSGCRRAEIEAYSTPRTQVRLLGAIIPTDDGVWMVKLAGESQTVESQRENFLYFVRSMRFAENREAAEPVTWMLPRGWEREAGRGLRYASIYIGEQSLVVTVFRFGPEAQGMVIQNVNRWRNQLNLRPISAEQFVASPTEMIGPLRGWIIDLEGKTLAEQPIDEPPEQPKFDVPSNWESLPAAGSQRLAGFRIKRDNDTGDMTVTKFPGDVGGLVANVNRWREQVGLPAIDENEIGKQTTTINVEGTSCVYVDAVGESKRVLGVIWPKDGDTIFFKLIGPKDVVGKEKEAFEGFVRAFKLGGK